MITRNSLFASTVTSSIQISTRERRNLEKKFWLNTKHTINRWEEVVAKQEVAMLGAVTHNHLITLNSNNTRNSNSTLSNNNINNSNTPNNKNTTRANMAEMMNKYY